jgi:hypothetical protein
MVIEEVVFADFKDGRKPVVKFVGQDRQLILNRTNSFILSNAFGDETDLWAGEEIQLSAIDVVFNGKIVRGTSISVPVDPLKNGVADSKAQISASVVEAPRDSAKGRAKNTLPPKAQRAIQGASPAPDGPHENSTIQAPEIDFE